MSKIHHRGGGEITRVEAIAHSTERKVADWFFVCDVKWRDGSESKAIGVSPVAICYDPDAEGAADARARIDGLLNKLNAYLEANGTWHDDKHTRDGRVYRWTPHAPKGESKV
jgi:hypothetical protein